MSDKLRLLDLFSGIGGFSLGLERSGFFRTVAFCEIEPFPRLVLKKHWPDVPIYEDVRTLTADALRRDGIAVDAICGGFPCQDISFSGGGEGLDGERSRLWFEYERLICELRPLFVIMENVSALLERGLARVLGGLASLRYDAEWGCVPASYIGAWHRRDRIWLVAYSDSKCGQQGLPKGQIFRQRLLHEQSTRSFEKWPGRSNLPPPLLSGENDGVPNRTHRLKGLGNAVVPQIPELIGRAIGMRNQFRHGAAIEGGV